MSLILVTTSLDFVLQETNACLLQVHIIFLNPIYHQFLTLQLFPLTLPSLDIFTCKAPCGRGFTRNYWYGDCEYTGVEGPTVLYEQLPTAPDVSTTATYSPETTSEPYMFTICGYGFERNAAGDCVDIDECLTNPCSGVSQICSNSEGSYSCDCEVGFSLLGGDCVFASCDYFPGLCTPDEDCVGVEGNFVVSNCGVSEDLIVIF